MTCLCLCVFKSDPWSSLLTIFLVYVLPVLTIWASAPEDLSPGFLIK